MDYPYKHVLEYRSYLFSIFVVLTINEILGYTILVPGGNNERSNGALNMVDFVIFSPFYNIES